MLAGLTFSHELHSGVCRAFVCILFFISVQPKANSTLPPSSIHPSITIPTLFYCQQHLRRPQSCIPISFPSNHQIEASYRALKGKEACPCPHAHQIYDVVSQEKQHFPAGAKLLASLFAYPCCENQPIVTHALLGAARCRIDYGWV